MSVHMFPMIGYQIKQKSSQAIQNVSIFFFSIRPNEVQEH